MTPSLLHRIIGLAMEVHNALGPHHAEIVYHRAMVATLAAAGLRLRDRPTLTVCFRGRMVAALVPDCIARDGEETVIVDFKADGRLTEADVRQMLGYLSAYRGAAVGLLLNFGSPRLTWRRVRLAKGARNHYLGAGSL